MFNFKNISSKNKKLIVSVAAFASMQITGLCPGLVADTQPVERPQETIKITQSSGKYDALKTASIEATAQQVIAEKETKIEIAEPAPEKKPTNKYAELLKPPPPPQKDIEKLEREKQREELGQKLAKAYAELKQIQPDIDQQIEDGMNSLRVVKVGDEITTTRTAFGVSEKAVYGKEKASYEASGKNSDGTPYNVKASYEKDANGNYQIAKLMVDGKEQKTGAHLSDKDIKDIDTALAKGKNISATEGEAIKQKVLGELNATYTEYITTAFKGATEAGNDYLEKHPQGSSNSEVTAAKKVRNIASVFTPKM